MSCKTEWQALFMNPKYFCTDYAGISRDNRILWLMWGNLHDCFNFAEQKMLTIDSTEERLIEFYSV